MKRRKCKGRHDAETRADRHAREAQVILPEGRHEPPPKMAQA